MGNCCWYILAFFCPPLAVLFDQGCSSGFWICLLLTCLFFIPGMIYACWVMSRSDKMHGSHVVVVEHHHHHDECRY